MENELAPFPLEDRMQRSRLKLADKGEFCTSAAYSIDRGLHRDVNSATFRSTLPVKIKAQYHWTRLKLKDQILSPLGCSSLPISYYCYHVREMPGEGRWVWCKLRWVPFQLSAASCSGKQKGGWGLPFLHTSSLILPSISTAQLRKSNSISLNFT